MSGIYIHGLEMPKCCGRCDFFDPFKSVALFGPLGYCKRTGDEVLFVYRRKENCPLIPVPDHGDLIERGKLMKLKRIRFSDDGEYSFDYIDAYDAAQLPAIIPADEEI